MLQTVLVVDMRVVRRWRLVGRVEELGGWLWCDRFAMCCVGG